MLIDTDTYKNTPLYITLTFSNNWLHHIIYLFLREHVAGNNLSSNGARF